MVEKVGNMVCYIFKRVIAGFFSLFMLITLTFFLMHVIPGGPFSPEQYRKVSAEVLENIQDQYGLNDPISVQYGNYLNNLADGISMVIATIDVSVPSFVLCVLAMLYSSSGMYDLRAGCVHYTFDAF